MPTWLHIDVQQIHVLPGQRFIFAIKRAEYSLTQAIGNC